MSVLTFITQAMGLVFIFSLAILVFDHWFSVYSRNRHAARRFERLGNGALPDAPWSELIDDQQVAA